MKENSKTATYKARELAYGLMEDHTRENEKTVKFTARGSKCALMEVLRREYEGEFKDAKWHGKGAYKWPDGSVGYDGEFKDNLPDRVDWNYILKLK